MKKRKGVAILSVLVVFVVTVTLSMAILSVYRSTVKQNVSQRQFDESSYAALSGLNIITSYIENTNDEFLVQYNRHLSSNGDDRTVPFTIPLEQNSQSVEISITSEQSQQASGSITKITTVYELTSVGTVNEVESKPLAKTITEVDTNGEKTFTESTYQ